MAEETEATARIPQLPCQAEEVGCEAVEKKQSILDTGLGPPTGLLRNAIHTEEYFRLCSNCGTLVSAAFLSRHYELSHPQMRDAWAMQSSWSGGLYSVPMLEKRALSVCRGQPQPL